MLGPAGRILDIEVGDAATHGEELLFLVELKLELSQTFSLSLLSFFTFPLFLRLFFLDLLLSLLDRLASRGRSFLLCWRRGLFGTLGFRVSSRRCVCSLLILLRLELVLKSFVSDSFKGILVLGLKEFLHLIVHEGIGQITEG